MIYVLTKVVLMVLFKALYRFSAQGQEHIGEGPVVLVANHTSYLDPVAVGLATRRPVHFIAKEELFKIPVFGWYIKKLHAFPIKRGKVDRNVMRMSFDHLKSGRLVLIFPEGTRHREDGLSDGMPGAAFIAYKAGARIIPTAIIGTDKVFPDRAMWPRFPRISVRFGEPIVLDRAEDKKKAINRATELIMDELGSMLTEVSV